MVHRRRAGRKWLCPLHQVIVAAMRSLTLLLALFVTQTSAMESITIQPGTDELHQFLQDRRASGAAAEPLELRLATGVHRLTRPLEITPDHGPLSFVGEPNSTISGGESPALLSRHAPGHRTAPHPTPPKPTHGPPSHPSAQPAPSRPRQGCP